MTENDLAKSCAQRMWAGDSASQAAGMRIEHVEEGSASVSMTVSDNMVNGHGICHGGYVFLLADSAFAYACNTYNEITVAQTCTITFLASARHGDHLTATARELSRKGRSGLYDVTIRNQNGDLIAEFRGNSRTTKGTILPD